MKPIVALCLAVGVAGCVSVPYDDIPRGSYSGVANVIWVGPNDASFLGDGEFLYVPVRGEELTFTRSDAANPSGGSKIIQPDAFYTDGGSVPRLVQAAKGFNAWGFGPAYVIHDWIFVAKKCLNDADLDGHEKYLTPEVLKISEMRFRESVSIMGETIKTLVRDHDIADADTFSAPIITNVTGGPISRDLWNEKGKCKENQVKDEHQDIVDQLTGRGRSVDGEAIILSGGPALEASKDLMRRVAGATFDRRVRVNNVTAFRYATISFDGLAEAEE